MALTETGKPKSSVTSAIVAGKIASIIGWPFTIFLLMVTMAGIWTKDDSTGGKAMGLTFCIMLDIAGFLFILYGKKTKDRIHRFRQYVAIINNNPNTTVEQIADVVKKPAEFVLRDLQNMIIRRYFVGATVDNQTHRICFDNRPYYTITANDPVNTAPSTNTYTEPAVTVVVCKSCGAKNKIVSGTVGECEYCGSPIQ